MPQKNELKFTLNIRDTTGHVAMRVPLTVSVPAGFIQPSDRDPDDEPPTGEDITAAAYAEDESCPETLVSDAYAEEGETIRPLPAHLVERIEELRTEAVDVAHRAVDLLQIHESYDALRALLQYLTDALRNDDELPAAVDILGVPCAVCGAHALQTALSDTHGFIVCSHCDAGIPDGYQICTWCREEGKPCLHPLSAFSRGARDTGEDIPGPICDSCVCGDRPCKTESPHTPALTAYVCSPDAG